MPGYIRRHGAGPLVAAISLIYLQSGFYTAAPRPGIRVADFVGETALSMLHVATADTRSQSGKPNNASHPRQAIFLMAYLSATHRCRPPILSPFYSRKPLTITIMILYSYITRVPYTVIRPVIISSLWYGRAVRRFWRQSWRPEQMSNRGRRSRLAL